MTTLPDNPERNEKLDRLIAETNAALATAETHFVRRGDEPASPVVLIIGPPRAGTTLLTHWFASLGSFAYPTNLLSRFSAAPAIGARIQRLLTDPVYEFASQFEDLRGSVNFESHLGKTRGALAPNEFFFFWRRHLGCTDIAPLGSDRLQDADFVGLRAELAALEQVFDKPLAMKGMMVQYDLPEFARLLPRAFFCYIRRDPRHNVQSLLQAREKYYGTRDKWYSARPHQFDELSRKDPIRQVAGQVFHTRQTIERDLAELPDERWLRVEYEDFCANPRQVYDQLRQRLSRMGFDPGVGYLGPDSFPLANQDRLEEAELAQVESAWSELQAGAE